MQSLAMIENLIHSGQYREALGLPAEVRETYELLAQGEYNVNYCFTHPESGRKLVLRVNMGSQMHLDRQIEYEAHALKLLADTGRTPRVHYVDGSGRSVDHGILVMDYLPGDHPDYGSEEDMAGAMAWVQYRAADKDLMNESTARKLDAYLSDEFLSLIEEIYA